MATAKKPKIPKKAGTKKNAYAKGTRSTSKKLTKKEIKTALQQLTVDLDQIMATQQNFRITPSRESIQSFDNEIQAVYFDIGDTLLIRKGDGSFQWAPGALEAVQALKSVGIAVGVISNTAAITRTELAGLFPDNFFTLIKDPLIVLSSEVGVAKPSLEIFYVALGRANLPARSCLFVGENAKESLAAQQAGMKALRVREFESDFELLSQMIS